jgi:hypothetical protein
MADTRPDRQESRPNREVKGKEPNMAKWQLGVLGAFLVIFAITAFLTGEPVYVIPVLILALLVLAYAAFTRAMSKRIEEKHGSLEDALSDEDEDIPSAHLIPDDETALGDTPEAHDEITPHDLPLDHPGRQAAEAQAGHQGGGTTRGNTEGGADGGGAVNQRGQGVGRRDV